MLTEVQEQFIAKTVVPLFQGWRINDALDALDYAQGYLRDFCTVTVAHAPAESACSEKE